MSFTVFYSQKSEALMSSHRPNRPENQSSAIPKQDGGEKESTKRHVYVEPGVKIDVVEDLKRQMETAHTESAAHNKKQLHWTIATAGLVFIYTGIMFWQSCLLRRSNEINREALESVQRAFVAYHGIEERRAKQGNRVFWEFQPTYENSGATPALDVINLFSIGEGSGELAEQEFKIGRQTLPISKWPISTIAPRSTQSVARQFLEESYIFGTFLGDDLSEFPNAHPKPDLYFWGWMVYRDVFRQTKRHLTEFCRHMDFPELVTRPPANSIRFNYEGCEQHNCTDEHCPDYEEITKFVASQNR